MLRISGLILALAIVACTVPPAITCSCTSFPSARAHIDAAEVIFVGRVIGTRELSQQRLLTEFVVLEELKGDVPQRVGIEHPAQGCRVDYTPDASELVFANTLNGALSTSLCMAPQFTEAEYREALRQP
jgi:hypothetical protein